MYRIAFAGSRQLSPGRHIVIVTTVVKQVLSIGKVMTGCATGSDEMVIRAVLNDTPLPVTNRLAVFTILDEGGNGGWKSTAKSTVRSAAARGAQIRWNAGGEAAIGLKKRLRQRTLAMLEDIAGDTCTGLIAFWTDSPGTRLSMVEAAKRGIRVIAYPLEEHPLPSLGNGQWHLRKGAYPKADPRNASAVWKPA